jgi:hypothetical protein
MTFLLEAKLESLKECHKGADDSVGSTTVLLYLTGCMGPLTRSRLLKQYNLMSNKHWSYWKECPFCVITRHHRPVVSTPTYNFYYQSYTPIYCTIQLYLWATCFDCFQSTSDPTKSKSKAFNNLNLQFLYRLTELAWRATNFKYVIPVCFTNTYNFYYQIHTNLLYSTTISLGYMFRLFSVIIRPYYEQVQALGLALRRAWWWLKTVETCSPEI